MLMGMCVTVGVIVCMSVFVVMCVPVFVVMCVPMFVIMDVIVFVFLLHIIYFTIKPSLFPVVSHRTFRPGGGARGCIISIFKAK